MTQVRRPMIAALSLFTAAITLDRLGVGGDGRVIAVHAYVVALLAVTLPLISRAVGRTSRWVVPVAAAAAVGAYGLLFGGGLSLAASPHLAVTETSFVVIAAWLGNRLASGLDGIDDLLATAAFGDSPALDLEGAAAAREIHTEFARVRRHGRPLAVTVLAPAAEGMETAMDSATLGAERSLRTRFLFGSLARTVAAQLRRSDVLFEHRSSGRLIVLSPETEPEGTGLLVGRILEAAKRSGVETQAGTATFPDDGVGFETLVGHAENALAHEVDAPVLRSVEQEGIA